MPQLYAINSLATVVKPISPIDRFTLVITAQKEKIFRVFDLVRQEEADRCNRKMSSVHVVSQEKVIGVRWVTATVEMVE